MPLDLHAQGQRVTLVGVALEKLQVRRDFSLLLIGCISNLAMLIALGCGPQGPLGIVPGGPLAGSVETDAVSDWSFTDSEMILAIETRGDWIDHSVTIMAAAEGPYLYIPSRQGYRKRWVQNIQRDPHVRIGSRDRIYPGRASRILDPAEVERASRALLRKYLNLEFERVEPLLDPPKEGDDRVEVWFFRIESSTEDAS